MKTIMTSLALLMATAPYAQAGHLAIIDTDAAAGSRFAGDAYFDQTYARLAQKGILKPVIVEVPDDESIATEHYFLTPPAMATFDPRYNVLTQQREVTATMQMVKGRLGYDIHIQEVSEFVNGVTKPTSPTALDLHVHGQTKAMPAAHEVTFAKSYMQGNERRMLIGYLID